MSQVAAVFGYIIEHAPELAGLILPPLVDVLNRDVRDENERFIVAVLTCVLVSVIIHWNEIMGGSLENTAAYFVLIFSESQLLFKLYFQRSFLRLKLSEKLGNNESRGTTGSESTSPAQSQ